MYSVDIKDCVFRHVLESGLAGGKICNKTANASSRYSVLLSKSMSYTLIE